MNADFYKKKVQVLENENTRLRAELGSGRQSFLNLLERLSNTDTELAAARRIIWAMAKAAGGEVRIPAIIMRAMNETCQIGSCFDPSDDTTVIKAKYAPKPKNGDTEKPKKEAQEGAQEGAHGDAQEDRTNDTQK